MSQIKINKQYRIVNNSYLNSSLPGDFIRKRDKNANGNRIVARKSDIVNTPKPVLKGKWIKKPVTKRRIEDTISLISLKQIGI